MNIFIFFIGLTLSAIWFFIYTRISSNFNICRCRNCCRFAFYLTGSAMYEILHLNYRGEMQSERISSNGFAGAAGLGVETWIDDLMVGLEVREVFAQRQNELKKSSGANTLIQAQLSWKF